MRVSPYKHLAVISGMAALIEAALIDFSDSIIDPQPIPRPRPKMQKAKIPDPDRQAKAQAKRERKQADRLRNAALQRGACRDCVGYDGGKTMPYYGHAPHTHNSDGTTTFAPNSECPANFEPDPEAEGLGTWHCPSCGNYDANKSSKTGENLTITHINSVAVQVSGLVYSMPRPNRHRHIYDSLPDLPKMNGFIVGGTDGFINPQTGEFMDRENALQYALQVGQIKAPQWDETKLFSEDLW